MPDTAPVAGAPETDPYPGFVEDIIDDEPEQPGAAPAAPPAAPGAETPAPGSPAQPTAPAEPAQPPTPEAGAPSPAAPPVPGAPATPAPAAWEFQADRQTVEVTGSKVREDGWLEVPPDQRPHLEQLLAEGLAHRGSWRQEQQRYESRIAELEEATTNNPDILKAKAFNTAILGILDKGPEAVAAWLDDYRLNFPLLKERAERSVDQAKLQRLEAQQTTRQEAQEAEELAPQIAGAISETLQRVIASNPNYKGVDARMLEQRIRTRFIDQVAYEVSPADRPRGLNPGEIRLGQSRDGKLLYVFNAGLVADEVAYQASLRGGAASAAAAAVTRNAAMTPGASGAPPVVPVGSGTPPGPPAVALPKSPKEGGTREQLQKWIDSGDWRKSFPG